MQTVMKIISNGDEMKIGYDAEMTVTLGKCLLNQKAHISQSKVKMMLLVFPNWKGIVTYKFVL